MIARYITFVALITLLAQCKGDQSKTTAPVKSTGIEIIDILTAEIQKTPNDPTLYADRAKAYLENGGAEYAIPDLHNAIRLDSLNPENYHMLSNAYMDNYQSMKALSVMMHAAEKHPRRTQTQLKLSETQLILQQYSNATSTLNGILKYDPLNAEVYFMLGLIFYEQEVIDKAENAFLTAVENDADLVDAWFMLGEIATKSNDPKAKRYYLNAVTAQPNSVPALHSLAFYLQNHDDTAGAQALYKKIHVLDKSYSEANLNSGILFIEQDSLDKAYEQFNIMVENKPDSYLGYYYRGIASELLGNLPQAMADYQNSNNINPEFEKAAKAVKAMEDNMKIKQ